MALSGLLVSPFGEICMTYQLQLTYRIVFYNPRLDMHHDHSLKFILPRIFFMPAAPINCFCIESSCTANVGIETCHNIDTKPSASA